MNIKFSLISCVILALTVKTFGGIQNVVVYEETGKFCAWPANEGVWSWGNEILVGFNRAVYKYYSNQHSYDPNYAIETVQARSTDGGVTWALETPSAFDRTASYVTARGRINFTHPDFALKVRGRKYFYSYDRGRNWQGPFLLPSFDQLGLDSRTDYVVDSQCESLIFTAAPGADNTGSRALVFKTANGGRTFEFLSFVGPKLAFNLNDNYYSIMSSTVRISDNVLVTALRTRAGVTTTTAIDIYRSENNGQSWAYQNTVATAINNPPSMIKLSDNRLCLTYGDRASASMGMRARISTDDGQTWAEEITLRDDVLNWDFGYPRMVQRSDGKVVTIYYYCTSQRPQQHIAATIWQP